MPSINFENKFLFYSQSDSVILLKGEIENILALKSEHFYIVSNGKIVQPDEHISHEYPIRVIPRLVGGKGGFGSMLRAIGAQIEKTTNREACRDLSGRRLRDINEEKRLKTWIAQQAEREKEADDRRQKKLERLCQVPKHEFKDETYEKERSALPERVEDALEQGLKASTSVTCGKRKRNDKDKKNKKKCLWVGSEDELSSADSETDDETGNSDSSTNKSSSGELPAQDSKPTIEVS